MSMDPRSVGALLGVCFAACASTGDAGQQGAAPAAAQAGQDKIGILTPTDYAAISIWPDQYAGPLLVLDVLPQGSQVAKGDVVATLDLRAIDDEIHRGELETQSASVRHQGVVEKNALEEQAARSALDVARASLERARRSLAGWKEYELVFTKRQDEVIKRNEQAYVDDQVDELDQLEKMYKADQLVDATEDIVIKRSRRQLDLTKTSNQLARDRSQYRETFDLALQTEAKEEAVRVQAEALERLEKQQVLDEQAREDARVRSADALKEQQDKLAELQRDRERLVLRAPRDGLLLQGAAKDYRPGKTPARFERGSQLAFRQDLFLVAAPAPTAVALDLNDAELARALAAANANVQTIGAKSMSDTGTLFVESWPRSSNATEAIYEARVDLAKPLDGALYGARAKVAFTPPPASP